VNLTQIDIDGGFIDASASVSASAPDATTLSGVVTHVVTIDRAPEVDIETTADSIRSNGDGTYTVVYTVTVANTGNTTISDMLVLDGISGTFPDADVALVSWTPGSSAVFSPALVLQPGTIASATYVVEVRSGGSPGPYPTVSTVTATSPVGDVLSESSLDVQLDVSYDLVVTHDSPTSAAPGSTYSHVFTMKNMGPGAAFGPIELAMSFDGSTPYESYVGKGWVCSAEGLEVTCTYQANLNAGASTQVTLNVVIDAEIGAAPSSTVLVAAANEANDSDPSSNVLSVALQVEQLPSTGLDSDAIGAAGLLLLLLGGVTILATRRAHRD
jgi:uncharacterized repeat protein (TIGR01451 family)/LPXTG-motif cell wall-anchored protein